MGGAYVAVADDPDALFWNPAGLGQISTRAFTAFLSRPFGIDGLSVGTLGYAQPTTWGTWGASFRTFGNKVYRENTLGLSCSSALWEGLFVGVTAKAFSLRIDRYGTGATWGIDVGCLFKVKSGLYGGLCVTNVNGPCLAEGREPLPRQISVGLRGNPVSDFVLSADVQKETAYGLQLHTGQEYRLSEHVALRAGLKTNPIDFTSGAGFYFRQFRLDYAFSSHSVLGVTHQVSMTVHVGLSTESPNNRNKSLTTFCQ